MAGDKSPDERQRQAKIGEGEGIRVYVCAGHANGRETLEAGACLKSTRLKSVQNLARFRHDNFSFRRRAVTRAFQTTAVRHNRTAKITRSVIALRIALSPASTARARAWHTREHVDRNRHVDPPRGLTVSS